jgi:cell division FtsZ-interacting protein ZapD
MAVGEDQGHVIPLLFGPWRNRKARTLERQEIRTEALHSADRRRPALRQAKTRRGAEEEHTAFLSRQFEKTAIEGVKKRLQRIIGHDRHLTAIELRFTPAAK